MPHEPHDTATGKLQKFKLREPYWQGFERRVN
jgi:fatty-acyl-CoA synthase